MGPFGAEARFPDDLADEFFRCGRVHETRLPRTEQPRHLCLVDVLMHTLGVVGLEEIDELIPRVVDKRPDRGQVGQHDHITVVDVQPQLRRLDTRGPRTRSSPEPALCDVIGRSVPPCNHSRRRHQRLHHRLRAGECLRVRCSALHAPEPGQAQKHLVVPPVASGLRGEALVQQLDLAMRDVRRERKVDRRAPEITIPLRDLIRQV